MKYYMNNITKYSGDIFSKTVIAKIENNAITDIMWDPDGRLESWGAGDLNHLWQKAVHFYDANHVIKNIFEWAAEGRLRI